MRLRAALMLFFLAPLNWAEADIAPQKCGSQASALVVSLQGTLEYDPESRGQWRSIELNQKLCEGSRIHVGPYSRASVLLPNGFVARIDEDTVLTFNVLNPGKPALMDLLKGFVHFISRTPKHLQINTPIANAGPEGTEFALSVNEQSASLWVYEGGVKFFNAKGSINLKPGQGAQANPGQAPQARIDITPQDAVNWALYYPPLLPYPEQSTPIDNDIRSAIRDFRQGRTATAIAELNNLPPEKKTPFFYKVRGTMLLTVGRVDLTENDIQSILKQNPKDAEALALQSVLALTQNRKEEAFTLAEQAIASNPKSASAYSALSYSEQGRFELDKALQTATQATKLAPHDAMVWARKAELELSLGLTSNSENTVQQAEKLDAELERTQTVIGFYHLQLMDADNARKAFEKALKLDSTSPLARLGLGLAKIRNGDLEEGRQDLEIAATLDPNNSLIRSYLGKAYYEENRNPLSEEQFRLAKERDPKDPTPYFYDALKKQTENRPVEALHDLQKSIDLNYNRAVYRSKQLLDSDRAARGASLARIYDNLGFEQRGIVEATSSLQFDPANYSAHRFLSDSYVNQPGRETAQLSELLQAKMLQPININPVQPHLSVSQRGLLNASGIANSSFQDFTRVFEGNSPQLLVSGVAGNQGILGDEVTLSGILNKISYSFGQFHSETDGFTRPYGAVENKNNTFQKQNIYDGFLQWAITDKLKTQFEYINRNTQIGSFRQNIDGDLDSFGDFYTERDSLNESIYRAGINYEISKNNSFLLSYIHSDSYKHLNPTPLQASQISNIKDSINFYEAQHIYKNKYINNINGLTYYSKNTNNNDNRSSNRLGYGAYSYLNLKLPYNIIGTLGFSYNYIDNERRPTQYPKTIFQPKIGLLWDVGNNTWLRFAYFRGYKKPIDFLQTLEPTEIAGFNQVYDNFSDRIFSFYGSAIDLKLTSNLLTGFELSRRDIYNNIGGKLDLEKDSLRFYLNWTPDERFSVTSQYKIIRDISPFDYKLATHAISLEGRYFDPSGIFTKIGCTIINQSKLSSQPDIKQSQRSITSGFYLLDASIGYRLPSRLGILSIEGKNLLNKKFRYEDLGIDQTNIFNNSSDFIPQRTFFGRIILNF